MNNKLVLFTVVRETLVFANSVLLLQLNPSHQTLEERGGSFSCTPTTAYCASVDHLCPAPVGKV